MLLRLLRLFKMLKMLRMIRVMKVFTELRLMLYSIMGSVRTMFWSSLMLSLNVHIWALLLAGSNSVRDGDPTGSEK